MRVSVVIPTYNSGPLLAEAVSSVLAQTRPAEEVIVVDDGSTDDTSDRVALFGSSVRYVRKENGGVSSARNRGIAEASGDVIGFLDADDVWHPQKLEVQMTVLANRPDLGLLGTRCYLWPGAIPKLPPDWVEDFEEIKLDDLIVRNAFVTSSVLARAVILQTAGPFDVTLHGPEDHDMWIRVARLTPTARLRLPLGGYRDGTPGSLSKNAVQMELGLRAILRKLDAAGVFRGKPLLRRKAWGYFRFWCAQEHHLAGNRWTAACYLARSLLAYPLPFSRDHVRCPFARLRLLASTILKPVRKPIRAS